MSALVTDRSQMRDNQAVPAELSTPTRRVKAAVPDATLAAAIDAARAAAQEDVNPQDVGRHLWVTSLGDRLVSHDFECLRPGYRGWVWSVTLSRAPRAKQPTVSEVNLLPRDQALMPPPWLPWSQRIAPGDLAPGDILPRDEHDVLLEPGYCQTGQDEADQLAQWELGLGRVRVLSREGRQAAADRWYLGAGGPQDAHAALALASCRSCGFFLPMAGQLRQVFGVCANAWSPSDGKAVSFDHGCGAHSEVRPPARSHFVAAPVLDDLAIEVVSGPQSEDQPAAELVEPGGISATAGDVPPAEQPQD